ncbi:MAG: hypothetical protein IJZ89_06190 [Clostridia bacterium]|nr:hypothetical protein [Clostridia bacterium]
MILAKVDKNFAFETSIDRDDIVWFSIREEPFEIYGLYDPKNSEKFCRMPADVAKNVSANVSGLNYNTAGGRVRFSTDSPYVAIKTVQNFSHNSRMTHAMESGFDLYSMKNGHSSFVTSFIPSVDAVVGFERLKETYNSGEMTAYTLNFPLYGGAKEVYIGIKEGSHLAKGEKYLDIKPVVYYGSSITQGGCASRPGNCYQAIISERYNIDYINLGFSGNCKAEIPMAEYLSGLDMSIFVCDYDHNAQTVDYLASTHRRLYDIFREKQPDKPYIMISKPDIWSWNRKDGDRRREIIFKTFSDARALGDKNVYFIDGRYLFGSDNRENCTIDGCHPNDLGFYRMAENIGIVIKEILENF